MITVAIVEDNVREVEKLKSMLYLYGDKNNILFRISEYLSAESFLNDEEKQHMLVFMDIHMPGMSGMDAAKKFREKNDEAVLIFVTNMVQYAMQGYSVDALDFIVKPFDFPVFALKIKRALSRLIRDKDDTILITTERRIVRIRIRDILYVEIFGHNIVYHTLSENFCSYGTLKKVKEQLSFPCFSCCKNCYYVNMRHVKGIRNNMILVGDEELVISLSKKKQFMQDMNRYMGGTIN